MLKEGMYNYKKYWDNRSDNYINVHKDFNATNFDEVKKIIDKYNPKSLVDGGCGIGRYFNSFGDRIFLGIELSKKLSDEAKKRFPKIKVVNDDLSNLSKIVKPKEYECFFSYTVLEHIPFELIENVIDQITNNFEMAIIREPINFDRSKSAEYCYPHDYVKLFTKRNWLLIETIKHKQASTFVFKNNVR